MSRLITAGCVLVVGLSLPAPAADQKTDADNPATRKRTHFHYLQFPDPFSDPRLKSRISPSGAGTRFGCPP
jgi:hypothetical protein